MKASRSFDETRKKVLQDPKAAALYLEECLQDGNMALFAAALKHVAEARGGVALLSKATQLNRETLYRTLSEEGNPRLDTLAKVLGAMGLRLGVVPVGAHSRSIP
ncbi:MAG: putative addiction module antidote protein [Magnetococcales bacterium]|nr:putative addiction module antidote protein [Magnetococcales bacterium]